VSEATQGWSNDPSVSLSHRVLVYAADNPHSSIDKLASALGSEASVSAVVDGLDQNGLLEQPEDQPLEGRTVALSPLGHGQTQTWDAIRQRRASRAMACRSALLDWLYDNELCQSALGHDLLEDVRGYFYGIPFTVADVDEAREFLGREGLIEGIHIDVTDYLRPVPTSQGKICVERYGSDVAAFLDRGRERHSVSYETNIHNSSGFQVANASQGATMHSTVTIADDHRQQLVAVARQMADQMQGLPEDAKPAAEEALQELRAAVEEPTPAKSKVRTALEKIVVAGSVAMASEAGKALVTLGGQALQSLGS
jgi:hypothetical protein